MLNPGCSAGHGDKHKYLTTCRQASSAAMKTSLIAFALVCLAWAPR